MQKWKKPKTMSLLRRLVLIEAFLMLTFILWAVTSETLLMMCLNIAGALLWMRSFWWDLEDLDKQEKEWKHWDEIVNRIIKNEEAES